MSKPIAQRLHERSIKVIEWTCRAESARTRKQAQKALRKIAKHSLKLAKLQARLYNKEVQEEPYDRQPPSHF
jgi:hypothetical protein